MYELENPRKIRCFPQPCGYKIPALALNRF
jgi:hypothetical protein